MPERTYGYSLQEAYSLGYIAGKAALRLVEDEAENTLRRAKHG